MSVMRFTGIARLQIMGILNDKTKGKSLDPGHVIATRLYKKVYISDKQQEKELAYKQVDEDMPPQLNPMAVKRMDVLTVDLDFEELAKLYEVLTDFQGLRPLDHDLWFDDVIAQLEEAKKPRIESEEERQKNLAEHRTQNRPKVIGRTG